MNEPKPELKDVVIDNQAGEQLKQYIEAVENYESEKRELADRIKEIFDNAKATGFDVKTIREIIKIRRKDKTELEEAEYLLETYKEVLGMDK